MEWALASPERDEAKGKEKVVPELVGETPQSTVGAVERSDKALKEEQIAEEDVRPESGGDVGNHVVGNMATVEAGGKSEVKAKAVPEQTEQEGWHEDGPEANDAAKKVSAPLPLAALEGSEDSAADEIAAENEEDDDGLVAGRGEDVENGKDAPVRRDLGKVDEEEVAPVVEENKDGRETAQKIEVYRSPGLREPN
jgi:hypothetical protein